MNNLSAKTPRIHMENVTKDINEIINFKII